jgi:hypothetical protein
MADQALPLIAAAFPPLALADTGSEGSPAPWIVAAVLAALGAGLLVRGRTLRERGRTAG